VNYTNVCVTRCRFCSFYRLPGHAEGYVLEPDEVVRRVNAAVARGATQVLLQGGHHPRLELAYFEDLFRAVRARTPVHLHGLSAPEVHHLARIERRPVRDVLERLAAAGLETLPGGGAEVLSDAVRDVEAPLKCTADEWVEVHRTAHRLGIRSSATMMFGMEGDRWEHRVEHLARLRALQDETGGFTAFIAWTFQPAGNRTPPGERSAMSYLRLVALARLFLDNVGTIQASPLTQPQGVVQLALEGGADDFGNILLEEHVVAAAGVELRVTEAIARRAIEEMGYAPRLRDTYYQVEEAAA
jgi:cyclic dehypoxanthinyl futalosine synthase